MKTDLFLLQTHNTMAEPQAKWKNKKYIYFLVATVLLLAFVTLLSIRKPYDSQGELKKPIPGNFQNKLVVEINSTSSQKTDSTVHVQKAMLRDSKAKDLKKTINQTAGSKDGQKGMNTSRLPGATSSAHSAVVTKTLQTETKIVTKLKDLPTIPSTTKQLTMQPKPPVSLRLPSGRTVIPQRIVLPESSSDVFLSVKTGGSQGEGRLSLVFLTWMQTINPKHVSCYLVFSHVNRLQHRLFSRENYEYVYYSPIVFPRVHKNGRLE